MRLGFGRTAGTARRFALRQNRDFCSILDAAEEITDGRFKEFPLDVALASIPSSQSLENSHGRLLITEPRIEASAA
jgi:hypothetical protein